MQVSGGGGRGDSDVGCVRQIKNEIEKKEGVRRRVGRERKEGKARSVWGLLSGMRTGPWGVWG